MLAANVGVLRQRALLTRPLVAVWLFFQIPASAHPVSKGEKVCVFHERRQVGRSHYWG